MWASVFVRLDALHHLPFAREWKLEPLGSKGPSFIRAGLQFIRNISYLPSRMDLALSEQQQQEITALKSIYAEDFIECQPRAWKVCHS